jgi:hypothetical protein
MAMMLVVMVVSGAAWSADIVRLDGKATTVGKLAIAGDKLTVDAQPLNLQHVRRIVMHEHPVRVGLRARRVYLSDGSLIIADSVTIADQQATIAWEYGKLTVPLEQVGGIVFVPLSAGPDGKLKPEPDFAQAIARRNRTADRLLAIDGERLTAIDGLLESLDDEQAVFVWRDKARKIKRKKVYGMVLAARAADDREGWCLAHLSDGSQVWGKQPALDDKQFTVARPGATITVPRAAVRHIDVRSRWLAFVSDLEPTQVEAEPLFTFAGWRADESILGRPLKLGGKAYEKGIGTHAPCRLTYALSGDHDVFAATVGIDDQTFGRGDCVMQVLLDGKVAWEARIKGGDAPRRVRVPLGEAKQITLAVEIGEDLDLSDHANWADARLVHEW